MKSLILLFTMTLTSTLFPQTPQWEFMGLAGEIIEDIAIDDSGNVYVASFGVHKSTDNGVTWESKNNGLEIGLAKKFFIDFEGNIYLGAFGFSNTGCGLYKSTDGGGYWEKIADTLNGKPINNFYDVTVIPNEPGGFIYVSNEYGVYRSTDNGITWQSTNFNTYLATDIGMNVNGYMFFGNPTASWHGIYRSTDLGLMWVRHTFLSVEFAMVFLRDGSILAGCYDPGLASYGIYKTTDNGDNWFNTNTLNSGAQDFVLDTNEDIYAAVGYVYLSTDNGISWSNYGLPGQGAFKLAIDSSGYVWAGADMDGVYKVAGRTVPVELASFSAEVNGNNVLLNWVTASEINNLGFDIERRIGNKEWKKIGFVGGNGTITEISHYGFIDEEVSNGIYNYRLKQIDFDGSYEYSKTVEVSFMKLTEFKLEQNYPNPFNPETNIDYIIPEEMFITISLYDITGSMVKELVNEKKQPGYYTLKLKGDELSSGIYFYRLSTSDGYTVVKKLTIIK